MSAPAEARFTADVVQRWADSQGFPGLPDDAAALQASDVEFRIRQIIQARRTCCCRTSIRRCLTRSFALPSAQEALKFMRHGKRSVLTTEDVNAALRLRNVEARGAAFEGGEPPPPPHPPPPGRQPVYGHFGGKEAVQYRRADGAPDVVFAEDRELSLDDEARPCLTLSRWQHPPPVPLSLPLATSAADAVP